MLIPVRKVGGQPDKFFLHFFKIFETNFNNVKQNKETTMHALSYRSPFLTLAKMKSNFGAAYFIRHSRMNADVHEFLQCINTFV